AVLTQPADYVKKKTKGMLIYRHALKEYPNIAKIMDNRHNLYNDMTAAIKEREKEGKLFVIRPPESLGIKRTENNPDELERVYQMGRSEAHKRLAALKEYLGE
ncbi:MAG: patatin family protein, partial [Lachnospiraceae bacterium]|nr:patatin family protein [Lachnospiraceae bacterium]